MLSAVLDHLRTEAPPLRVPMGRPVFFADAPAHMRAWAEDPELYALSAIASGVSPGQRSRALYVLLSASWKDLGAGGRALAARVVRVLLASLPASDVLTVMLALRRARANHKHTSRAIVRYLSEHPSALALAQARRPVVRDVLEHAVGRNTLRAAAKLGTAVPHARDAARMQSILAVLASGLSKAKATPFRETLLDASREAPKTVTATNRGDVSATLVHIYRGGVTEDLCRGLDRYVARAASKLPRFDGSIALVLDASASMRGYGDREYCSIAQSVALALVLERVCENVRIVQAGGAPLPPGRSARYPLGDASLPAPAGATDLAGALLEAADGTPDVIAIVSDGYENVVHGDLADVARALPGAGVAAPVVVCQSKFTFKDVLALRRPAPALPEISFWHEDDFEEVLLGLASHTRYATSFARRFLEMRLDRLESAGLGSS